MRFVTTLFLVLLVGTAGCSSKNKEIKRIMDSPIGYQSYVSPDADFNNYETWEWMPAPTMGVTDPRASDPTLRKVVEDAVEKQMSARGYQRTERLQPDLIVNYHVISQRIDKDYIKKVYDGSYDPDYRMNYKAPGGARHKWDEGALVVFIFDSATREMVWQGTATAEVTDEAPEPQRIERLNKAAKTMFTSLPGRPHYGTQSNSR